MFSVISRTFVGGVLPICGGAVGVFYSPNRLGKICNQDIGMKFGIEKYSMAIMKNGKRESVEIINQQNQECIKTLGKKQNYNT